MSQKSAKNLSTLSKHMTNDTKLQVNTNTVSNKLIIPVLSAANANPTNGEMYVDSTTNHLHTSQTLEERIPQTRATKT